MSAEKQASSEIAQSEMESRRRYAAWIRDHKTASEAEIWQAAERDTRERCAQIVENEPLGYITESEHEKLENFADRVVERIRGKE